MAKNIYQKVDIENGKVDIESGHSEKSCNFK